MNLKHGSMGLNVTKLQEKLNIKVDGNFGSKTENAVKQYQTDHNLDADGVVGDKTWASLFQDVESNTTWPKQSECDEFYDNPRGSHGASSKWESENLIKIIPPWQMIDEDSKKPISHFLMHRKVKDSLDRILNNIWNIYNQSQEEIENHSLHIFSGSYVFRNIRGGTHLSMHSYGCALDLASSLNELGKPYDPKHGLPMIVIHAFEAEGATWGGRWGGRPDAMHFQFARV